MKYIWDMKTCTDYILCEENEPMDSPIEYFCKGMDGKMYPLDNKELYEKSATDAIISGRFMNETLNSFRDSVISKYNKISDMPPASFVTEIKSKIPGGQIFETYDNSEKMNTFLELLDGLEYSVKNGRTEEAIVLLREKIINMFNDFYCKREGRPMDSAPLDGTKILVKLSDHGGFDIARWDGVMWVDNHGVSVPLDPIRWWILPKAKHKKHYCKDRWLICETMFLNDEPQDEFLISCSKMPDEEDKKYMPFQSAPYCPICGASAEKEIKHESIHTN